MQCYSQCILSLNSDLLHTPKMLLHSSSLLTIGYNFLLGEVRGSRDDFDGEESVYHLDGIDIYDQRENGSGFSFATYTRYPGRGFKGGHKITTVSQLEALYFGITGKPFQTIIPTVNLTIERR